MEVTVSYKHSSLLRYSDSFMKQAAGANVTKHYCFLNDGGLKQARVFPNKFFLTNIMFESRSRSLPIQKGTVRCDT